MPMRERGCDALLYLPDELSPCASVPKSAPSHTYTLACLHAQGHECKKALTTHKDQSKSNTEEL